MGSVRRNFLEMEIERITVEGDKNTKFFYIMVNAHSRRNFLARVRVDGSWLSDEEEIKERVSNAYQHLSAENGDWRPSSKRLSYELGGG